jgi:hypothetical protein
MGGICIALQKFFQAATEVAMCGPWERVKEMGGEEKIGEEIWDDGGIKEG